MSVIRHFFFLLLIAIPVLANAQQSKNIKLLCHWTDTANIPENAGGQRFSEVWGFSWNSKEYGVIGSTIGAHIIDIDACKEVVFAPAKNNAAVHRDYKTYKHYLYAATDDGNATNLSSLQVFDFSFLPDSIHLVYESNPDSLNRSHKLFIDTATAKLYCASATGFTIGHDFMRVYSLTNPEHPTLLQVYNFGGDVHDVYVRNDTAYCSSSDYGFVIADFTKNPYSIIGALTHYTYQGFNHSNWIGPNNIGVMADETWGMPVKVIDVTNPARVKEISHFGPRDTASTSIPHNPYMRGNFAFVSYYEDGLQVYDLTDPYNPVQAGFYRTYTGSYIPFLAGAWSCYPFLPSRRILVGDMNNGLYVFDADDAIGIHKGASFTIYPNPVTGNSINIQLPYNLNGPLDGTIYDVAGRVVMCYQSTISAQANPPITLPLRGSCVAGMYILRVAIAGQIFTGRFTKL